LGGIAQSPGLGTGAQHERRRQVNVREGSAPRGGDCRPRRRGGDQPVARADRIWPWLLQMGWHRGGWYTPRWVDQLLFPANRPSAIRLIPGLQGPLHVGDRIPDGPPGTAWFVVEHLEPSQLLVLHSTTHVPATWRARLGASIDWTWIFALQDSGDGRTRLLVRTRARTKPWWLTSAYVAALVPADYLMATGMLTGIRRRICETTLLGDATRSAAPCQRPRRRSPQTLGSTGRPSRPTPRPTVSVVGQKAIANAEPD
jgi:hypothetical protein